MNPIDSDVGVGVGVGVDVDAAAEVPVDDGNPRHLGRAIELSAQAGPTRRPTRTRPRWGPALNAGART